MLPQANRFMVCHDFLLLANWRLATSSQATSLFQADQFTDCRPRTHSPLVERVTTVVETSLMFT